MLTPLGMRELDDALPPSGDIAGPYWPALWTHAQHRLRWWPEQMIVLYPDEVEAYKAMPLRALVAYTLMTREEIPSLNHAFVVAALYLKLQMCSISTLRRTARRIRGTA